MSRVAIVLAFVLVGATMATAAGDLSRQAPVELRVILGAKDAEYAISPKTWNLQTGKLYKIVLVNEGKLKHEWMAPEFTLNIWTRKVQVGGVEVKGVISEIEVGPGTKAEWWFVPIRTGTFEMACELEGHRENGMVGKIVVK